MATRRALAGALTLALLGPVACGKDEPSSAGPSPSASASAGRDPFLPRRARELVGLEHLRDSKSITEADLSNRDVRVRRRAARALARIGDAHAADLLRRALSDEDASVVAWSAYGLGYACKGREPETVRALVARAASWSGADRTRAPESVVALDVEAALTDALARCATREAEITLRAWLDGAPPRAEHAALALGRLASRTSRLDDASIVALLDAASRPEAPLLHALFAFTRLKALSESVRERLWEVAQEALSTSDIRRPLAVRALGTVGEAAATRLAAIVIDPGFSAAERSDAARELARLGEPGQQALGTALTELGQEPADAAHLVSPAWGPLVATLDALRATSRDTHDTLTHLSELPVPEGAATSLTHRLVVLRCRAAQLLAGTASLSKRLVACDPAPQGRVGALAVVNVLDRGRLGGGRGRRWLQFATEHGDAVVRAAALRLIPGHPEIRKPYEVLAAALRDEDQAVVATAAQVLAAYPNRASAAAPAATPDPDAPLPSGAATLSGPPEKAVVEALTQALRVVHPPDAVQVRAALIDAAGALQLLNLKPAINEACQSPNPTLRQHAETALRLLGERKRICNQVPPPGPVPPELDAVVPARPRLRFVTSAGPKEMVLYPELAPVAVARVLSLAQAGFYEGTVIHRVVPGFVVQFGDPRGDGFGGAGRTPLRCETSPVPFERLAVGVALSGRDTGSSQLFVTLGAYPHLDGDYPWIGRAEGEWDSLAAGDVIDRVEVLP